MMMSPEDLEKAARSQVRDHEAVVLQSWSEIRAGHKHAMTAITEKLRNREISYDESQVLIQHATDLARRDSTLEALLESGDICEQTFRMFSGIYGQREPGQE